MTAFCVVYYSDLGQLVWKWKPLTVAPLREYYTLCPISIGFYLTKAEMKTTDVMLESQGCQKVKMEIFECVCEKRKRSVENEAEGNSYRYPKFVKGVNGEVYKVSAPGENTKCSDQDTFTINQCVDDGEQIPRDFSEIEELFFKNRESKCFIR